MKGTLPVSDSPAFSKAGRGPAGSGAHGGVLKSPALFSEVQTEEDNSREREWKTLEVSW